MCKQYCTKKVISPNTLDDKNSVIMSYGHFFCRNMCAVLPIFSFLPTGMTPFSRVPAVSEAKYDLNYPSLIMALVCTEKRTNLKTVALSSQATNCMNKYRSPRKKNGT